MKRARAAPGGPGTLERHELADDLHDIRRLADPLDNLVGDHVGIIRDALGCMR
jgi:hypothetical protein